MTNIIPWRHVPIVLGVFVLAAITLLVLSTRPVPQVPAFNLPVFSMAKNQTVTLPKTLDQHGETHITGKTASGASIKVVIAQREYGCDTRLYKTLEPDKPQALILSTGNTRGQKTGPCSVTDIYDTVSSLTDDSLRLSKDTVNWLKEVLKMMEKAWKITPVVVP
jgi:hypothetical protein